MSDIIEHVDVKLKDWKDEEWLYEDCTVVDLKEQSWMMVWTDPDGLEHRDVFMAPRHIELTRREKL